MSEKRIPILSKLGLLGGDFTGRMKFCEACVKALKATNEGFHFVPTSTRLCSFKFVGISWWLSLPIDEGLVVLFEFKE